MLTGTTTWSVRNLETSGDLIVNCWGFVLRSGVIDNFEILEIYLTGLQ